MVFPRERTAEAARKAGMTKQPSFPELSTTSLPELFEQVSMTKFFSTEALNRLGALMEIASRWHDIHCECKIGKDGKEAKVCLRCANVRRMILEPPAFRDLLISIAEQCKPAHAFRTLEEKEEVTR